LILCRHHNHDFQRQMQHMVFGGRDREAGCCSSKSSLKFPAQKSVRNGIFQVGC